jgi:hypothetical protein
MNHSAIKKLFQPGDVWNATRTDPHLPNGTVTETRCVLEMKPYAYNGRGGIKWMAAGQVRWTEFPKAKEITESKPNRLRFTYPNGVEVTLTKNS